MHHSAITTIYEDKVNSDRIDHAGQAKRTDLCLWCLKSEIICNCSLTNAVIKILSVILDKKCIDIKRKKLMNLLEA